MSNTVNEVEGLSWGVSERGVVICTGEEDPLAGYLQYYLHADARYLSHSVRFANDCKNSCG